MKSLFHIFSKFEHNNYYFMIYKQIGQSDLNVSGVCLGMMSYGSKQWRPWILDQQKDCDEHVDLALSLGINFFDTANIYSSGVSETMTGKALNKLIGRDKVIIATKVGLPIPNKPSQTGLSKEQIILNFEQSLKRLNTDYIDLYQIHRWDYLTPIEETMEALHSLIISGKLRYIGASSMYAWQFSKCHYLAELNQWTAFISMQNHYNIIYREEEREMNPLCQDLGVSLLPWSPVARGLVCGTRTRKGGTTLRSINDPYADRLYDREADYQVADAVIKLADQKDVSGAEIALAWLHQNPIVASPIFGATKTDHLKEAVHSLELKLSPAEIQSIETPYQVNIVKPWNL